MLFVRKGVIDFLEVVTIVGDWPADPVLRSITWQSYKAGSPDIFMPSKERNLDVVRKSWAG